jgi:hypothetical protein
MSTLGAAVVGWESRMGAVFKNDAMWCLDTGARTVATVEKWRVKAGQELTPVEAKTVLVCEDIKNACGIAMWPKAIYECGASAVTLFQAPSIGNAWECFMSVTKLGGPIVDTVELVVRRVWEDLPYAEDILGWLTLSLGIGMVAKGVGECNDLRNRAIDILNSGLTSEVQGQQKEAAIRRIDIALIQAVKTLSDLVKTIAYLAIAIIFALTYFVFKKLFVPSWTILACSTAALCSSYFSKLWDVVLVQGVRNNNLTPTNR